MAEEPGDDINRKIAELKGWRIEPCVAANCSRGWHWLDPEGLAIRPPNYTAEWAPLLAEISAAQIQIIITPHSQYLAIDLLAETDGVWDSFAEVDAADLGNGACLAWLAWKGAE